MALWTTHIIVGILAGKLFEAEDRRLAAIINALNQRNKRFGDNKLDGFLYNGNFYLPQNAGCVAGTGQAKTPLHLSLHDEMEGFLKDRKSVEDERRLISQMLFLLLSPCRTTQAVRDALPECLAGYLPELARLTRTDEPAWTIRENPRALRQYEKTLPKIEVYSATQLLY